MKKHREAKGLGLCAPYSGPDGILRREATAARTRQMGLELCLRHAMLVAVKL